MYLQDTINEAPTYFPKNFHYTQGNLMAFGIFAMVIMFSLLIYCVWIQIKNCRCCCHGRRDKMYYKLMGENYELRKEYKRDFYDLKEQIRKLSDNADVENGEEKDS